MCDVLIRRSILHGFRSTKLVSTDTVYLHPTFIIVIFFHNTHHSLPFISLQPLSAANEYHVQGEKAGLSAGDLHFACFNRLQYVIISFWSGQHLSVVKGKISDACSFMKDHDHKNCLPYILLIRSTVRMLLDSNTEVRERNKLLKTLQEKITPHVQMLM